MTDSENLFVQEIASSAVNSWQPFVGEEALRFLDTVVPDSSRVSVSESSSAILGKGIAPVGNGSSTTGLVIGYVQSGKTMSFEAVAALARDNGYQVVIVIAGTSTGLLEQSGSRLEADLGLDDPDLPRRWLHLKNPDAGESFRHAIRGTLDAWSDEEILARYRKTVLITVLKHHSRLGDLCELLEQIDLQLVPVLVVDDEADQASLNTKIGKGEESATYRQIMRLRSTLPAHTYLQYTATPQAPLLINIIDVLSPSFVYVLDPGESYVGGRDFFSDENDYVREILPDEIPANDAPLSEPPASLLNALRLFMLGVADGLRRDHGRGNRSMLVHPSHRTATHQLYYYWIRSVFEAWKELWILPADDPDRCELVSEFRAAHDDLTRTVGTTLGTLDELIPYLRLAFGDTRILEVNSRAGVTPPVEWRSSYGWILVGGQAMDRGFTVEGLTVTYMPRGIGVGNADTVQQRGRFFGYKRDYIGYCRVYVDEGTMGAFRAYIEHEEDIRRQLKEFQVQDMPLSRWKRAFILDSALRPCRRQVLDFDYMRGGVRDEWLHPRIVQIPEELVTYNRQVVSQFVQGLNLVADGGHSDRAESQRHQVCREIPLEDVLDNLLVKIRIPESGDSQRNTGLLLQLSRALENSSEEECTVFLMRPTMASERGIDDEGLVKQLFQGPSPKSRRWRRGEVYGGDRGLHDEDCVTVQIHVMDLTTGDESTEDKTTILRRVPVVAVRLPPRLRRSWIVQEGQ